MTKYNNAVLGRDMIIPIPPYNIRNGNDRNIAVVVLLLSCGGAGKDEDSNGSEEAEVVRASPSSCSMIIVTLILFDVHYGHYGRMNE